MAVWLRKELKANVLILDSYWSRGRTENWLAWTESVFVKIVVRFFKVFAARTPCPVAAAYLG